MDQLKKEREEADIREEGRRAYVNCKSIEYNPYPTNSLEWAFWYTGWNDTQTPDTEVEESEDGKRIVEHSPVGYERFVQAYAQGLHRKIELTMMAYQEAASLDEIKADPAFMDGFNAFVPGDLTVLAMAVGQDQSYRLSFAFGRMYAERCYSLFKYIWEELK